MPKLTALTPIRHNGVDYAEGDSLDVKDKAQAAALLDCGAAFDPKAPDPVDPATAPDQVVQPTE